MRPDVGCMATSGRLMVVADGARAVVINDWHKYCMLTSGSGAERVGECKVCARDDGHACSRRFSQTTSAGRRSAAVAERNDMT